MDTREASRQHDRQEKYGTVLLQSNEYHVFFESPLLVATEVPSSACGYRPGAGPWRSSGPKLPSRTAGTVAGSSLLFVRDPSAPRDSLLALPPAPV